jgi:hypothetical protein
MKNSSSGTVISLLAVAEFICLSINNKNMDKIWEKNSFMVLLSPF